MSLENPKQLDKSMWGLNVPRGAKRMLPLGALSEPWVSAVGGNVDDAAIAEGIQRNGTPLSKEACGTR